MDSGSVVSELHAEAVSTATVRSDAASVFINRLLSGSVVPERTGDSVMVSRIRTFPAVEVNFSPLPNDSAPSVPHVILEQDRIRVREVES